MRAPPPPGAAERPAPPDTLAAMPNAFCDQLERRILGGAAPAVAGLDPRLEALPQSLLPGAPPAERILGFYREVLPLLAPHVCVAKPNIAYFERFGAAGYAAFEATCQLARSQGMLVLGDVKRGDIGPTAEAYADAHFPHCDAVTLHPLLGTDSVQPFLAWCRDRGRGVFVLVRTSNPSAKEFQDLRTEGGPLCDVLARAVQRWGEDLGDPRGYSPVGAVVGATWPAELARLRTLMPRAWILLPGVGAQGARAEDLGPAFDARGLGGLITQSRGLLQCFAPNDPEWRARVRQAAQAFAAECRLASRGTSGEGCGRSP